MIKKTFYGISLIAVVFILYRTITLEVKLSSLRTKGATTEYLSGTILRFGVASISELFLRNVQITDDDLKIISQMHRLRTLDFAGSRIAGANLTALSSLKIEEVNLAGTDISDQMLESITNCKDIKVLNLNKTKITSLGVRHLFESDLPIGSLSICCNTNLSVEGITLDRMFLPLQSFDIHETTIGDEGLSLLTNLTGVTRLNISDTPLTEQALVEITRSLVDLRQLSMRNHYLTPAVISSLMQLRQLENLDISGAELSTQAATTISTNTTIKHLHVIGEDETTVAFLKKRMPKAVIYY